MPQPAQTRRGSSSFFHAYWIPELLKERNHHPSLFQTEKTIFTVKCSLQLHHLTSTTNNTATNRCCCCCFSYPPTKSRITQRNIDYISDYGSGQSWQKTSPSPQTFRGHVLVLQTDRAHEGLLVQAQQMLHLSAGRQKLPFYWFLFSLVIKLCSHKWSWPPEYVFYCNLTLKSTFLFSFVFLHSKDRTFMNQ